MLKLSYFKGLRNLNANALIICSDFFVIPVSLRMGKTGRKNFFMDQVSKNMVTAITDIEAEASIRDVAKKFSNFGLGSLLVKKDGG
jgi:hypothetical protein